MTVIMEFPSTIFGAQIYTKSCTYFIHMHISVRLMNAFYFISLPQVQAFLKPPMLGVVLQTYGCGNAPNNREDIISEIKKATHRGVLIVNCTQCLHGPVVDQYATGKVRN